MKKKTVFGISFALASMLFLSTVVMANQVVQGSEGITMTRPAQIPSNEELAAKILNRSPNSIRQLVARGLKLEELLIAEGKYEEYKSELQKMNAAGGKDKNVIIEIGDHSEREDSMAVRIIASLDKNTDDKVKVEVTGLSDKEGAPEKSKCIVLDSKQGKIDVWVTDGKEGGSQSFTANYNDKNQLGVQTGNVPYTTNSGMTGMNAVNAGYGGTGAYTGTATGTAGYQGMGAGVNTGYGGTGAYTGTAAGTAGYQGMGAGANTGYGGAGAYTGTAAGTAGYQGMGAGVNTGYGGVGAAGRGMGTTGGTGTAGRGMGTTGGTGTATGYTTGTGGAASRTGYSGGAAGSMTGYTGAGGYRGAGASQTVSAMSVSNGTYYPTESRILGLTQTQLKTALDNGSTIYSLMSASGKLNEYKEELVTQNRAAFNKALSEGKFDKQTANKMQEYFEQKISAWDGTTPIDMFKIKVG